MTFARKKPWFIESIMGMTIFTSVTKVKIIMMKTNQNESREHLEQIIHRLANGVSNDVEIDTLRDWLWAAFESIPTENHSQFFSKITSMNRHLVTAGKLSSGFLRRSDSLR